MITNLIVGALIGSIVTILVLNNNPKLAAKLKSVADIIEKKIEDKTGKDI